MAEGDQESPDTTTEDQESTETPQEGEPPEQTETLSETDLRAALDATRKEANASRRKLREAETKVKEFETAQLNETEKAAAERDEAKAETEQLRERVKRMNLKDAVTEAAREHGGFVDAPSVHLLVPPGEVSYDDDGGVTNAAKLVEWVAKALPGQTTKTRGTVNAGAGQTGAPSAGDSMNSQIRNLAGRN